MNVALLMFERPQSFALSVVRKDMAYREEMAMYTQCLDDAYANRVCTCMHISLIRSVIGKLEYT